MGSVSKLLGAVVAASAIVLAAGAGAQEVRHYRFAYDQPKNTGYGILGDIFSDKLRELSKGTMLVDQYPGAQLGQEPQVLQLVKAGDIEFCISSSANAATLSPQAGVMSMHFLFRSEAHLVKAIADPEVSKAVKAMIAETVQGTHVIALATLGLRNMYSKREIRNVGDMKGLKVRVQATPTEDTMFPAYGAQIVHMPFGSVYTSLQTGVVDVAENGVNVYLANKHYEVAPVMSMTEHEANNSLVWVSDKLWNSLTAGTAGLGPDRRRRGQQERARQGDRARAPIVGEAEIDRGQGRRRRRQIRLYRGRGSLPRQAVERTRTACRKGQGPDPGDQLTMPQPRWDDCAKS